MSEAQESKAGESNPDKFSEVSVVPPTLRWAGYLVAFEGLVGLVVAAILIARALGGHSEEYISGFATAIWFLVAGGAVFAAGLALRKGRRWGRGVAVFAQLMLVVVAISLLTGSHLPVIGAPVLLLVLAIFGLLFAPGSTHWLQSHDLPPDAR